MVIIFVENDRIKCSTSNLNKLFSFTILQFEQQKCKTAQYVLKIYVKINRVFAGDSKTLIVQKNFIKFQFRE